MRTTCFFCAAWLCTLFSATASAQTLSSDEIVKLLSGTTIETTRGRQDWPTTFTFKSDGTIEGVMEHEKKGTQYEEGKWWTQKKDGYFCRQWRTWGRGKKRCRLLVLEKDRKTIKVLDRDGNEIKEWVIK